MKRHHLLIILVLTLVGTLLPDAAVAQIATLSATTITFGNVVVGAVGSRNLSITNTGSVNLVINSITASTNFGSSNCNNATIVPNGKCTVSVTFSPSGLGVSNGTLSIADNASNSPQVVNLSGNGVAAVIFNPPSLTFPNQAVSTTSVAKNISLVNNQGIPLNISSVAASGAFTASSCPSSIAALSTCVISVTFAPTSLGSSTGTLTVTDDASTSPQSTSLTGSGVQPVTLFPTGTVMFASQTVGTTSNAKTITVTNNQSVPMSFTSITASGDFSASGCTSTVAAYANCVVSVTFTPTVTGTRTGTLTITDTASNSPQTVSLNGTGVLSVSLSPTTLQFSSQVVGTTSQAKITTLLNNQSTALGVTSVTTTGPFAASTCPASIPAGGNCAISVTYTPTTVGQISGTLTVVDSASGSPQTASLQGTGTAAQLSSITVTPATPTVTAGTTQPFTATGNYNNGTTQNLSNSVIWASSATSVATINSGGIATAASVGSTTITATSGSVSGAASLTVSAPVLVSIAVTPVNSTITSSATQQFTATGTYSDSSTQNLTNSVVWGSSNNAVATISASGLASAVASGTTAISATSGSITGSTNLTVGNPPTLTSIAVTPASPSVALTGSQQFTATGTFSDGSTQVLNSSSVNWSAGGVAGGNTTVGTITSAGLYTAPSTIPSPAQVSITATSTATSSVSGSASATVVQVSVTVSPATASTPNGGQQQFTATVTGPSNTTVTWSAGGVTGGNSTVGTISSSGLYVAPSTIPNPPQVTITATSNADGTTSGSATETVTAPVSVAISPSTTQTVPINGTKQFTATVTGSSNTAVTWSVGGVTGGNIIVGTISTSGLYTGPPTVPNPTQYYVTATSVADSTKSASVRVTVSPAQGGVSIIISPVSSWAQIGGPMQFLASVFGSQNINVTWSVNGVAGGNSIVGTISPSGLYTAPTTVPSPAQVTVTGTSVADSTKSASGVLTVGTTPFSATPLIDFTPGQVYAGFSGLLYDGSNLPPQAQVDAGQAAAALVQPLDNNGVPNANGKIVLISLGMSESLDEWCDGTPCTSYSFMGQAAANSSVNHSTLVILNGASSGANTASWACAQGTCPINTSLQNQYDRVRDNILTPNGVTEAQVQAVWIQEATPSPTWSASLPNSSADVYNFEYQLGQVIRSLKARWPNVQQVFVSSRIYAGYATTNQSPEPYAYEYGFAVKFFINTQLQQRQTGTIDPIAGDLLPGTMWIDWGPYIWGNDSNNPPGSTALSWVPADFTSDGIHPSNVGVTQVADTLMTFFLTSSYTPWFLH